MASDFCAPARFLFRYRFGERPGASQIRDSTTRSFRSFCRCRPAWHRRCGVAHPIERVGAPEGRFEWRPGRPASSRSGSTALRRSPLGKRPDASRTADACGEPEREGCPSGEHACRPRDATAHPVLQRIESRCFVPRQLQSCHSRIEGGRAEVNRQRCNVAIAQENGRCSDEHARVVVERQAKRGGKRFGYLCRCGIPSEMSRTAANSSSWVNSEGHLNPENQERLLKRIRLLILLVRASR